MLATTSNDALSISLKSDDHPPLLITATDKKQNSGKTFCRFVFLFGEKSFCIACKLHFDHYSHACRTRSSYKNSNKRKKNDRIRRIAKTTIARVSNQLTTTSGPCSNERTDLTIHYFKKMKICISNVHKNSVKLLKRIRVSLVEASPI